MIERRRFHILIVEENKELNDNINKRFKDLGYRSLQAFNANNGLKYFRSFKERLRVVVISTDIEDLDIDAFIHDIQQTSKAYIILLSSKDDYSKREHFFSQGILDFYLKSNPTQHIVDDIDRSVQRLEDNKSETILLIDDSKLIRATIKFLLQKRNYNLIAVATAQEGIDIMESQDISLLLLDLELPDMHGIKVLEVLRDLYLVNSCPILVLSGSKKPSIVREALKKGSSDFIKKPFAYEEFLLKIDLWIKSSRWQKTIKKQKKQIENNFDSFKALVDSTLEALFVFKEHICTDVNDEAVKLLGLNSKDDIISKELSDIFKDISKEKLAILKDDGVDQIFEDTIKSFNGSILDVNIKEKNIMQDGENLKIVAVMDITNIKRNEKMLSHQTKMASMGEMIGNIAHQWRQPLTAISVAAGGIKLNYELGIAEEEETLRELDNIVENTQFLSSTIEDFQNFLKNDRSLMHFSFNEAVEKTLNIIKANLESHEISIIKLYENNIQLYGVKNDFIQVMLNIINNAADILKTDSFKGKEKYILIDVKQDGESIVITIQDNAGGIPQDIIGKVFEPYFTTKHQSKGTGLGLYMTHQIVTNTLKGTIEATNRSFVYNDKEYYGAAFIITVPLTK